MIEELIFNCYSAVCSSKDTHGGLNGPIRIKEILNTEI